MQDPVVTSENPAILKEPRDLVIAAQGGDEAQQQPQPCEQRPRRRRRALPAARRVGGPRALLARRRRLWRLAAAALAGRLDGFGIACEHKPGLEAACLGRPCTSCGACECHRGAVPGSIGRHLHNLCDMWRTGARGTPAAPGLRYPQLCSTASSASSPGSQPMLPPSARGPSNSAASAASTATKPSIFRHRSLFKQVTVQASF